MCNAGQASFAAHKSGRRKRRRCHSGLLEAGQAARGALGISESLPGGVRAPVPTPGHRGPAGCRRQGKHPLCAWLGAGPGTLLWLEDRGQLRYFDAALSKQKVTLIIKRTVQQTSLIALTSFLFLPSSLQFLLYSRLSYLVFPQALSTFIISYKTTTVISSMAPFLFLEQVRHALTPGPLHLLWLLPGMLLPGYPCNSALTPQVIVQASASP